MSKNENETHPKKLARNSFKRDPFVCLKPWPEDCFVQCGGNGVVLKVNTMDETFSDLSKAQEAIVAVTGGPKPDGSYRTAFFEAFPKNPSCFIRGEGESIEAAEEKAFSKYVKIVACPEHEFDRRGREDGYAYCTKCSYSSTVLEPTTSCAKCQKKAHFSQDKNGLWYCQKDFYQLDYDRSFESQDRFMLGSKFSQRKQFFRSKTETGFLISKGFEPGSEDFEALSDLLLRAEVWSGNDDLIDEDREIEVSDSVIETEHLQLIKTLIAWLLSKTLTEKDKALVDRILK